MSSYDIFLVNVTVASVGLFIAFIPLALMVYVLRGAIKTIAIDAIEIYSRLMAAKLDILKLETAIRLGVVERRQQLTLNEEQAILAIQERRRQLLIASVSETKCPAGKGSEL